uniref:Uncharacterized protein n=1 Tax=viral metagenome TaxID=1070528 RepID=A0A6C0J6X7_9ZZZZ
MKVPPNTAFKKLYFLLKENPLVKILKSKTGGKSLN